MGSGTNHANTVPGGRTGRGLDPAHRMQESYYRPDPQVGHPTRRVPGFLPPVSPRSRGVADDLPKAALPLRA